MNYEEKYKKSLDRAMNLFVTNNISATAVCEIFPELNKSEEVNYEKKYKEAFERMKSWANGEHPECFSEAQKTAEFIFPELKESEDEKIKREIVAYINELADLKNEKIPTKWLAWLEKQGEHKPFDYENVNIQQKDFAPKIESKFKVGDKVTIKGDNTVYTIGIIAPDKTCWLKHGSHEYGWATFGVLKHYVE